MKLGTQAPRSHWIIHTLLSLPLLTTVLFAQITVRGKMETLGQVQFNSPFTRNVQIMALDPPGATNVDFTNFYNDVMTNPNVDGVTVEIDWSLVETTNPATATPCPQANSGTCQMDSAGVYHNYDWSAYDNTGGGAYPNGIAQWFNPFTDPLTLITTYKKVNLILSGINAGGAGYNTVTPWYVASPNSNYLNNFTPARQDVLNAAKDCSNLQWSGINTATFSYSGTANVAKVSFNNCCTLNPNSTTTLLHDGDTIWVYNGTQSPYNQSNVTVSVTGTGTFTYSAPGLTSATGNCSLCIYISAAQSTPVPYEAPYVAAWEAFMAAANAHFSSTYVSNGIVVGAGNNPDGTLGTNQLGYVRSGTWVGGESYVYCIKGTNQVGATVGLSYLSGQYQYKCNGSDCSMNNGGQTNANNTWLMDYANKVNYIQSIGPTMARFWPIDQISGDNSYADVMAADATATGNAQGYVNGFGSQGLSLLDELAGCSGAIADWCNLFTGTGVPPRPSYYRFGMPLELQQLSISDPTNTNCNSGCGFPPNGVSGDLRIWLPFAVANQATVFEIYYADLGLAFDQNYCNAASTACYYPQFPNVMTLTNMLTWFNKVGQGAHCGYGVRGSGDCSYASTIHTAHGPN